MATYVVGDIHGCWATLERLLGQLPWDEGKDHLWLTGDLVNRGPASLAVLRWARQRSRALGERFVTVLGNHDLHLLAVAAGVSRQRPGDTLGEILEAPEGEALLRWLRRQPLLHRRGKTVLVHAGLWPEWTLPEAERQGRRLERALQLPAASRLLDRKPTAPRDALPRLRRALHAFTQLRTLRLDGEPCRFSGPPAEAPAGCLPWFRHPRRRSRDHQILFGHWAALGFHRESGVLGLDSGCVWGQRLTALRLDDGEVYSQTRVDLR
jgi:bis(5'-nucleosyl)-tetraphosphatase (symmetrical)